MKNNATDVFNFEETEYLYSLKYSQSHGGYILDSGDQVATFIGNFEEYMMTKSGQTESLIQRVNNQLGTEYKHLNFFTQQVTSLTNEQKFLISAHDNNVVQEVPFGSFLITYVDHTMVVKPFELNESEALLTEDKHDLYGVVDTFFKNKSTTRRNKKGILLYGPQGNGKTSNLFKLRKFAANGAEFRVFFVDEGISLHSLNGLRKHLAKDKSIFILEEITERMDQRGIKDLLTFLDGENSWDNAITIATTNYPEQLPSNIVDRPGRFDTFLEYKNPSTQEITALATLFKVENGYEYLFNKDLSFDYVSYILDQSIKQNKTVEETYQYEKEKRAKLSETFKGRSSMGI